MPEKIILKVDINGERIDKFVSQKIDTLSRQKVIELIKSGGILINGSLAEPSKKVRIGDEIQVNISTPPPFELEPQDIPFEIVYEDEGLLIINKPPHLVVHPACGHNDSTLVNALLYRVSALSTLGGKSKPGIVHRLDKGTSGLMLIAKNDSIHSKLGRMFERHTIKKFYRLITFSVPRPDNGTIETLYGRDPNNRKRFTTRVKDGKKAITIYRTLMTFERFASLAEAQIVTGRTHQIRVHFSEVLGCPIIGDNIYTKNRRVRIFDNPDVRESLIRLDRPLLHSYRIEFTHPLKQKWLSVSCEPPADFLAVLNMLKREYGSK